MKIKISTKIQTAADEEAMGEDRLAGLIFILCIIALIAASTLH